ncbi:hypothetical protein K4L06_03255 [Lysobacter sp. BMK333-48F3]|uniref:LIC_13387 family protein n=1 Tax=Lysobacter sp. BMK333-48F3 TaxID=2867962 RepID=UPI001C8B7CFF|nr:hypothetical protein [Lysobacter sp. BMK333-48F3]MBX9400313.1 hypothetical protein [Lysobacter sp. BMK333-48F3]
MTTNWLVLIGAALMLYIGTVHLLYTLFGRKLEPAVDSVKQAMAGTPLRVSPATDLWRAWVGFNAGHSAGMMLFGAAYAYLAWAHPQWLAGSAFLCAIGAAFLAGLVWIAKRYMFRAPFFILSLVLALYLSGAASALIG